MKPAISLNCYVACVKCNKLVNGILHLDGRLAVCDSTGFLIAGMKKPHIVCDNCARIAGMPMSDDTITDADIKDPKRLARLIDSIARGQEG